MLRDASSVIVMPTLTLLNSKNIYLLQWMNYFQMCRSSICQLLWLEYSF